MAGRFTIEAVFKGIDRITAPISKIGNKVGMMSRQFQKGAMGLNRGVNRALGGIRRVAAVGAIALAGLSFAMVDVIKTGANFEQQMVIAAGKMGRGIQKGTKEFLALESAARAAGRTTEFTATQSAEALTFLAQAGFDANAAMSALPKTINFATASQTDLATATRIATKSMGAFGLLAGDAETKMKNLERVTDLMVKTSNSANTSLEEMFDAVRKGAPIARRAGASIEDTAVLIAAFADVGIDASESGVGLRQVMLAIAAPTSEAARVMRKLKVATTEVVDGVKKMRNPLKVFNDMKKALKGIDEGDQLDVLVAIFGKKPAAKAINLIEQSGEAVKLLQDRLLDYGGTVDRVARQNRDTVAGSFKALLSAIESVKLSIFLANKGPIKDLIDSMTKWVRLNEKLIASKVNVFIKKIVDNWPFILKMAKAITVFTVGITALIVVLKILVGVMTVVNLVMAANPAVLIAGAIALLIITIMAAVIAVVLFSKELENWWDSLGFGWKLLIGLIGGPLFLLMIAAAKLKNHWEPIKAFFASLWDSAIEGANKFIEILKHISGLSLAKLVYSKLVNDKGGDTQPGGNSGASPTPQVIGPQERAQITEHRTTKRSELTIKDETGRASFTSGGDDDSLELIQSGVF